tara:strand:+ start:352 stop:516 length:165 start_codon:yes stop_codon:yes gene_type:complete
MAHKLKDILSKMELAHLAKIKNRDIKYFKILTTDKYKADKSDEAVDKVFNKKNK